MIFAACPDQFLPIEETFGSPCYFLSSSPLTFPAARADCIARGGILAEPPNDSNVIGNIMAGLMRVFPAEFGVLSRSKSVYIFIVSSKELRYNHLSSIIKVPGGVMSPITNSN